MAAAQQQGEEQVKSMHQYKIPPPTYDGNHSQFEEWKYRFTAYAGLINSAFPRLLNTAETSQQAVTDQLLTDGASNATEAQLWVRLAAELQFILISTTKGAAATVCRQMGINANGFETWRQLHRRFSIPVGTRSIGYLTKLLKPSFDEHRFEEAFASWEFEVNRYERENTVNIPDSIKIAILLNETKGALQQHLQLTASNVRDYNAVREIIIEYYRTTASFTRMQQLQDYNPNSSSTGNNNQGPTPMDIGATYHSSWKGNKGKGKKGHHKGKGKHQGKGTKEDIHQDKETRSKEHQKDHQEKESNHSRKASKAKEKERMDATSAANRATSLRIAESQSIMLRKKDIKDINRIGIRIQHMTGIKTSGKIKDGIKTIRIGMDKSNSTQHNQQHHQIPQDHKQHRASTPWWTSTQRQLHQSTRLDRHRHRRMSCSQESTSWSTVGQQQMFAHHGLELCIHSIRWSRTTSPSWGQSQALTSGFMGTDGFISSMSKIDRLSSRSTFVMSMHPSCQSADSSDKVSRSTWEKDQLWNNNHTLRAPSHRRMHCSMCILEWPKCPTHIT